MRFVHTILIVVSLSTCVSYAQRPIRPRVRIVQGGVLNDLQGDMFSITELSPTVYVNEVGGDIRGQIDRVIRFVADEQWSEAVDMLVRLSEQVGHKLTVSTSANNKAFTRFVSIQELVQEQLAVVARESKLGIQGYRDRVDPLAEQWFAKGIEFHDQELLEKIVLEAFHSSVGDNALLALGGFALESGDTDKARRYWNAIHANLQWQDNAIKLPFWQRLVRGELVSSVAEDLVRDNWNPSTYYESEIAIADVWARLVLASILDGNRRRASAELSLLRNLWPDATGMIAGQDTNYLRSLSDLLNASHVWPKPKRAADWTTFAGSASRNFSADTTIDIPTKPSWRVKLKPVRATDSLTARTHNVPTEKSGESRDRLSGHFPIVVNDLVLIHDENRIRCLDLQTGSPAWKGNSDGTFFSNVPTSDETITFLPFDRRRQPTRLGEQRFTLSASKQTVVVTIGSHHGIGGSGNPALIGFDLMTEGGIRFGPIEMTDGQWSFQGAPLCERNQCWVGMRQRGATSQDFVACFDMRNGTELWRTRICSADTIGKNAVEEFSGYLLTKHEDVIFSSSHLGAVAAIGASDGAIRWLTTYPRTGPKRTNLLDEHWHALRDLTPCLYHDGLLIVAPSDANRIFALHADTGDLIWDTEIASDVHATSRCRRR